MPCRRFASLAAVVLLAIAVAAGPRAQDAPADVRPTVVVLAPVDADIAYESLLGLYAADVLRIDAADPARGAALDDAVRSLDLDTILIDEPDAAKAVELMASLMRESAGLRAAAARSRPALVQLRREDTAGQFSLRAIAPEYVRTLAVATAVERAGSTADGKMHDTVGVTTLPIDTGREIRLRHGSESTDFARGDAFATRALDDRPPVSSDIVPAAEAASTSPFPAAGPAERIESGNASTSADTALPRPGADSTASEPRTESQAVLASLASITADSAPRTTPMSSTPPAGAVPDGAALLAATATGIATPAAAGATGSAMSTIYGPLLGLLLAAAVVAYANRDRLVPAIQGHARVEAGERALVAEGREIEQRNPRLRDALDRVREKLRVWERSRKLAAEALRHADEATGRGTTELAAARRGLRRSIVVPEAGPADVQALHRTVVRAAGAFRQAEHHVAAARSALDAA